MNIVLDTAGHSPALAHAVDILKQAAVPFVSSENPEATHLLLPVPAFNTAGNPIGCSMEQLTEKLKTNPVIIGGRLNHPALAGSTRIDLLQDEGYLWGNAAITAHCAIKEALCRMDFTFDRCPVLIVGWGRIGQCLARLLRGLDAHVTVAARKIRDRAAVKALGYTAIDTQDIDTSPYRVIFNTVPASVLTQSARALNIELSSVTGIAGDNVILARGLPAKDAPFSSGQLIADTVIQLL